MSENLHVCPTRCFHPGVLWKDIEIYFCCERILDRLKWIDDAGRRTDFWDQKSSDFSGEIFRERNYCPRTAFSGSNSCSILSHPVMSWYGSRAVGCPLGREITAGTCSLLGNEGTPPDFERFFLEKRPWKRFSTNVLIRGKWIHSTAK